MCLPTKTENSSSASPDTGARSLLGLSGLMLIACIGGPALVGAIGGLGAGVLLGIGGTIVALAMCAAVPAVAFLTRRRSARSPTRR